MKLSTLNFIFRIILVGAILSPGLCWAAAGEPTGLDPAFLQKIRDFQAAGGKGKWLKQVGGLDSRDLYDYKPIFFHLTALPARWAASCNLNFCRTPEAHKAVQSMMKKGVVIVVGNFHSIGFVAATVPEGDGTMVTDVLKQIKKTKARNLILVSPEVSLPTITHEFQHWLDYENPALMAPFNQIMDEVFASPEIADDHKFILQGALWELRGYSAEKALLRAGLQEGQAIVAERSGQLLERDPERSEHYRFELNRIQNDFRNVYLLKFNQALGGLKDKQPALYEKVRGLARTLIPLDETDWTIEKFR